MHSLVISRPNILRFVTLLFAIRDSTATGSSTRQPGITDTGATATVAATAASVNDSEDIRAAAQLPPIRHQ